MHNIGNILHELRTARNLSRRELSKMINCSESTIVRIEKGETKASEYMISQFENIFHVNLNDYYTIASKYHSYDTYLKCMELKNLIYKNDIVQVAEYITLYNDNSDFKFGEPYLLLCYCNMLVYAELHNKYDMALNLGFTALDVTDFNNLMNKLDELVFCNTTYSIFLLINNIFDYSDELEKSYILSKKLYYHFKYIIFNNTNRIETFDHDLQEKYLLVINNYARSCLSNKLYIECVDLSTIGIEYSLKFNSLIILEYLHLLLMEANYQLGNLEASLENEKYFISLCQIKKNSKLLANIDNSSVFNYSNLI